MLKNEHNTITIHNRWNRTIGIEPLGSKAPIKIADKETSTQLTVNYIQ